MVKMFCFHLKTGHPRDKRKSSWFRLEENLGRACFALGLFVICGCQGAAGNVGRVNSYPFRETEAVWVRNGDPIEFEGELWYPADGVENFMDSEMLLMGEYRGIQFFTDKVDIRPYSRLYTKFERNKFRFFEKAGD